MKKILIIGLNTLSEKIANYINKLKKFQVYGFDFDVDKIELYKRNNFIINDSRSQLNVLLKESDVIILNIEISKYESIFRLSPFIKNDCLIINTNTYKEDLEKIREILKNKNDNFIPCNLVLFPENIVMNYDKSSKMNSIHELSDFCKEINVKTSVLLPSENNLIFGIVYQIPFIFEKLFLKNNNLYFLSRGITYDFIYSDIFLNKKNIVNLLNKFINIITNNLINNEEDSLDLLNKKIAKFKAKSIKDDLNNEIFIKIVLEKLFIKSFVNTNIYEYLTPNSINFDYLNYSQDQIKEFFISNKDSFEIILTVIKEKIINLISFLEFEETDSNKIMKYLTI